MQCAIPSSTAARNTAATSRPVPDNSGQFLLPFVALDLSPFKLKQTPVNLVFVLHRGSGFAGLLVACGNVAISGDGSCLNYCEVFITCTSLGARGGALRYKPEGRGFESRWCHWNFSLTSSFHPQYGGLSLQQK